MPILAHFWGFDPLNGAVHQRNHKRHTLAQSHRMMLHVTFTSSKLVDTHIVKSKSNFAWTCSFAGVEVMFKVSSKSVNWFPIYGGGGEFALTYCFGRWLIYLQRDILSPRRHKQQSTLTIILTQLSVFVYNNKHRTALFLQYMYILV